MFTVFSNVDIKGIIPIVYEFRDFEKGYIKLSTSLLRLFNHWCVQLTQAVSQIRFVLFFFVLLVYISLFFLESLNYSEAFLSESNKALNPAWINNNNKVEANDTEENLDKLSLEYFCPLSLVIKCQFIQESKDHKNVTYNCQKEESLEHWWAFLDYFEGWLDYLRKHKWYYQAS